jgi:E-phenylitaconyl-CoA hydratase
MFVTYERQGHIGIVTLDRPDRLNSIGAEMARDLEAAWQQFTDDEDAWVGVLLGNGRAFCAGRDVKGDMTPIPRTSLGEFFVPDTDRPLIAGVHGHVIGMGWYMVAGCDYCVAADDAGFVMTQLRVGLPGPYTFAARMNLTPQLSFEICVLGTRFDAQRSRELGLINEVVAQAQLRERTLAVAEQLLAYPPRHVRLTKSLLRRLDREPDDEMRSLYWDGRRELENHPDTAEVRHAMAERRPPSYSGA